MKFEYNKDKVEARECVAYIDGDGDLTVWDCAGDGGGVIFNYGHAESGLSWAPETATHKFYAGDSITITF